MKLVRWRRFTWDLAKLPPLAATLPKHYALRPASQDEQKAACAVVFSAFSLDMAWSDAFKTFRARLDAQIAAAFLRDPNTMLVITHGQRIIAASALNTEVDADTHLLSGPCVLVEYRNRGIGTILLHASLKHLAQAGLSRAHGICKETAPASKFVYPKFGSTGAAYQFEPLLASS